MWQLAHNVSYRVVNVSKDLQSFHAKLWCRLMIPGRNELDGVYQTVNKFMLFLSHWRGETDCKSVHVYLRLVYISKGNTQFLKSCRTS